MVFINNLGSAVFARPIGLNWMENKRVVLVKVTCCFVESNVLFC